MLDEMGWTHGQKEDERFPKITETKKQGDCRKRERPQLRWEDCLKIINTHRGKRKVGSKGQQHRVMEALDHNRRLQYHVHQWVE